MHFNSIGEFSKFLMTKGVRAVRANMETALDGLGQAVAQKAEDSVGFYQPGIGQYPAWAPLASSTIETKQKNGWGLNGNPDSPLYATGNFERAIGHKVDKSNLSVQIGTSKDYIVYTELGTVRMPARPVFGPAALNVLPSFLPTLGKFAAAGIGGVRMHTFPQGAGATQTGFEIP